MDEETKQHLDGQWVEFSTARRRPKSKEKYITVKDKHTWRKLDVTQATQLSPEQKVKKILKTQWRR